MGLGLDFDGLLDWRTWWTWWADGLRDLGLVVCGLDLGYWIDGLVG